MLSGGAADGKKDVGEKGGRRGGGEAGWDAVREGEGRGKKSAGGRACERRKTVFPFFCLLILPLFPRFLFFCFFPEPFPFSAVSRRSLSRLALAGRVRSESVAKCAAERGFKCVSLSMQLDTKKQATVSVFRAQKQTRPKAVAVAAAAVAAAAAAATRSRAKQARNLTFALGLRQAVKFERVGATRLLVVSMKLAMTTSKGKLVNDTTFTSP